MFKDKLKQLRLDKGVTQSDIAKAIGVSPATIGNYEQGTREPRNNAMWQKLADYFGVSVDYLMDKTETSYVPVSERVVTIEEAESNTKKKNPFMQFREDVPIIYDDVDITSLVFSKIGETITTTREQRYAYTEFTSRSGHVLFARKKLLSILHDIKESSKESIIANLQEITERIENNVVYWYNRCWNNIDDVFPTVDSIETLYDLLGKCLCVDMIAQQEFTLLPLDEDFDWLREKLH